MNANITISPEQAQYDRLEDQVRKLQDQFRELGERVVTTLNLLERLSKATEGLAAHVMIMRNNQNDLAEQVAGITRVMKKSTTITRLDDQETDWPRVAMSEDDHDPAPSPYSAKSYPAGTPNLDLLTRKDQSWDEELPTEDHPDEQGGFVITEEDDQDDWKGPYQP